MTQQRVVLVAVVLALATVASSQDSVEDSRQPRSVPSTRSVVVASIEEPRSRFGKVVREDEVKRKNQGWFGSGSKVLQLEKTYDISENFSITRITAEFKKSHKHGEVRVVTGGVGDSTVTLKFSSHPGRNLECTVHIYAQHRALEYDASHNFEVGTRANGDVKVYERRVTIEKNEFRGIRDVVKVIEFVDVKGNNVSITQVQLMDRMKNLRGLMATRIERGPGDDTARIRFTSSGGNGLDFLVRIYAKTSGNEGNASNIFVKENDELTRREESSEDDTYQSDSNEQ